MTASSVTRPASNNSNTAGSSARRRAIATKSRARRGDTPHCHDTQCSAERMPLTAHVPASSTSAIRRTSAAVVALTTPINSLTRRLHLLGSPVRRTHEPILPRGCDSEAGSGGEGYRSIQRRRQATDGGSGGWTGCGES